MAVCTVITMQREEVRSEEEQRRGGWSRRGEPGKWGEELGLDAVASHPWYN